MSIRAILVSAAVAAIATSPAAAQSSKCKAQLASGSGDGQGVLGKGTKNAREAATRDWTNKVASAHGERYSKLSKARNVTWDCKRTPLKATCVVTAKPCR